MPEQTQTGLDKLAKGDLPEVTNIIKAIIEGYNMGCEAIGIGIKGEAGGIYANEK